MAVKTRYYIQALESAGIPVALHQKQDFVKDSPTDPTRSSGPGNEFAFTIVLISPTNLALRHIPDRFTTSRYTIANWVWEQTELPDAIKNSLHRVDEIWASSEFVRETYARSTELPVTLIPHPIRQISPLPPPVPRSRFGIPEDRYAFLSIAAFASSIRRKNPLGALRAFRRAFPHGQTEAVLVMKLHTGRFNPSAEEQLGYFASEPEFGNDVILVTETLTDDEMTSLTDICDAFVSLPMAEGFGLGPAEAMSLGKPAVVTNWSGPVDYLTPQNSLPIPYTLQPVEDVLSMWGYIPGLEWADPDLDVAASRMRSLVDQPSLGPSLGRQAALDMVRHSISEVGAVMARRLEELHRR
jgi:glycosyltransferase involved in cell wall biosynthesis